MILFKRLKYLVLNPVISQSTKLVLGIGALRDEIFRKVQLGPGNWNFAQQNIS